MQFRNKCSPYKLRGAPSRDAIVDSGALRCVSAYGVPLRSDLNNNVKKHRHSHTRKKNNIFTHTNWYTLQHNVRRRAIGIESWLWCCCVVTCVASVECRRWDPVGALIQNKQEAIVTNSSSFTPEGAKVGLTKCAPANKCACVRIFEVDAIKSCGPLFRAPVGAKPAQSSLRYSSSTTMMRCVMCVSNGIRAYCETYVRHSINNNICSSFILLHLRPTQTANDVFSEIHSKLWPFRVPENTLHTVSSHWTGLRYVVKILSTISCRPAATRRAFHKADCCVFAFSHRGSDLHHPHIDFPQPPPFAKLSSERCAVVRNHRHFNRKYCSKTVRSSVPSARKFVFSPIYDAFIVLVKFKMSAIVNVTQL